MQSFSDLVSGANSRRSSLPREKGRGRPAGSEVAEGNREAVLSAYRTLRDTLQQRVRERLEKLVATPSKVA